MLQPVNGHTFVDDIVRVKISYSLQELLEISSSHIQLDTACHVDERFERGHIRRAPVCQNMKVPSISRSLQTRLQDRDQVVMSKKFQPRQLLFYILQLLFAQVSAVMSGRYVECFEEQERNVCG